jgi:energy-converting hydrogenase Eha subunit B
MDDSNSTQRSISPWNLFHFKTAFVAWLAMLGFDFFLHGGLLSGFYTGDDPYLLTPLQAFNRIPIGYAGFLLMAAFLVWLAVRLKAAGWWQGARLGLGVGLIIWLSQALGLYSITRASIPLLLAWTIGQSIEMGFAGGLIGIALERHRLRRPFWIALISAVIFVILTVLLQTLGLTPTTRI